jgi:RHS repeat-associated protein
MKARVALLPGWLLMMAGISDSVGQNIVYIPAVTNATIASKTIDTGLPVGAIAGTHGVTATGGASYAIPIFIPPGTNGLAPELSLVYNSQSGDGPLGTGWGISGLSAITRVGSDDYHDGVTAPVAFTADDHFALDGQRLVPTNGGAYGDVDTEYDAEGAQFLRVTSPQMSNACPEAFRVLEKSCNVRWYGAVGNSDAQFFGNQDKPFSWHLNRVVDPYGNQVQYSYNMGLGGPHITEVRWGGTTDAFAGVNRIEFIYGERSDMTVRKTHDLALISTSLLSWIKVYGDGELVRQYELRYANGCLGRSYLNEIVEYGMNGAYHNSTIFEYPDVGPWLPNGYEPNAEPVSVDLKEILTGDFNGDGRMDRAFASYELVTITEAPAPNLVKNYTNIKVQLNGSLAWTTFDIEAPIEPELEFYGIAGKAARGFFLNDLDGDGRDDIVITKTYYFESEDKYALVAMWVWQSTANSSTPSFFEHAISIPSGGQYNRIYRTGEREAVLAGDFTGDGRADVLTLLHDGDFNQMRCFLWQWGQGWGATHEDIDLDAANQLGNCEWNKVFDMDGDGKVEIVALQSDGWQPFRVIGRRSDGSWGTISAMPGPVFSYQLGLQVGDLNGDGMQDLIYRNAGELNVRYGRGTGFTMAYSIPLAAGSMVVADLNNDGFEDIFHATNQSGQWVVRTGLSRGLLLDPSTGNYTPAFEWSAMNPIHPIGALVVGDRNGNGTNEVFSYLAGGVLQWFECRPYQEASALKTVCDGLLNKTRFNYAFTSHITYGYENDDNLTYPTLDFNGAIHVVRTLTEPSGGTLLYKFGDGAAWKNGPGFIGFEKVSMESSRTDLAVVTESTPDDNYATLLPTSAITTDMSTEIQLRASTYLDIEAVGLGPMKRFIIHLREHDETNGLSGVITTVSQTFNSTGDNIISRTTEVAGVQTKTETFAYDGFGPDAPQVYANRLTSVQTTTTRAGSSAMVNHQTSSYDYSTGALVRHDDFGNASQFPLTYEVLDLYALGSLKTEQHRFTDGQGSGERNTKYKYDEYERAPISVAKEVTIDGTPLLASTLVKYHYGLGLVQSTRNAEGLTTLFRYDDMGRSVGQSAPHLASQERFDISTPMEWAVDEVEGSIYKITKLDPGAPQEITYFDRFGRVIEVWVEGFVTDTWSKSRTAYDWRGRVTSRTEPALDGEVVHTTNYSYDELDRLSQSQHSLLGNTTSSFSYEAGLLKTTVTDPALRVQSTWTDAAGLLVKAEDAGGKLFYTYNSHGQIERVKHGSLTVMTLAYDAFGYRTQLWDQSAGLTTYRYDPFGQLVWQQSANGDAKTFEYDELGRLLSTLEPEGEVKYTYFTNGSLLSDKPIDITGFGAMREFTYDPLMRLSGTTMVTPEGPGAVRSYGYDDYDRLAGTEYEQPLGIRIMRKYTAAGYLEEVYDDVTGRAYFRGMEMDGQGRYTQHATFDGQTHDAVHAGPFPVRYSTDGIQDLHMEWDPTAGDVLSRWDALKGRKETFQYDQLDRLKRATLDVVNGNGELVLNLGEVKYDYDEGAGASRGNLIRKSDMGRMAYAGHMVNGVVHDNFPVPSTQPPLLISLETQHINYTSYHQPFQLTEKFNGDEQRLTYHYGPEHQRVFSRLAHVNGDQTITTRLYDGDYERQYHEDEGIVNHIIYVQGGTGLCAMVVFEGESPQNPPDVYSVYTDHLGSIVALTKGVDEQTTVLTEQSFDAWGRARNPSTWQFESMPLQPVWLYRGYTSHEHIEPFTLINMNGRVYDSVNGRMLSADNHVNGPNATQAFNRYSYAANNPLSYTDPSGEYLHLVVGAVVGGLMNWTMNNEQVSWKGLGYFAVGAVAGGLSAGVGAGVGTSLAGGSFGGGFAGVTAQTAATGFAAGAVSSGAAGLVNGALLGLGNALLDGGTIDDALRSGRKKGLAGMAAGFMIGGIIGGIDAVSNDLSFFTGQSKQEVGQEFLSNGTVVADLAGSDLRKGSSFTNSRTSNVPNSRWFNQVRNPDGTWTVQARTVGGLSPVNDVFANRNAVDAGATYITSGRMVTINSPLRVTELTIVGMRSYALPLRSVGQLFGSREISSLLIYGAAPLITGW